MDESQKNVRARTHESQKNVRTRMHESQKNIKKEQMNHRET